MKIKNKQRLYVLTADKIREWDAYTIKNEPISGVELMERAAFELFYWIEKRNALQRRIVVFAGCGNNGGDGFALARLLYNKGYQNLIVYWLHTQPTLSNDAAINLKRIEDLSLDIRHCYMGDEMPEIPLGTLVIDAIFGSGLSRPITGYWAEILNHINSTATEILAIDVPSGLMCDDNSKNTGPIIRATNTLTFQVPKLAFLFAENVRYIGDLHVLDIGLHDGFLTDEVSDIQFIDLGLVAPLLKKRTIFDHKGTFGHAFLIAGGYQKMGAAVLAAKACMRSGVGLLTVHLPESGRIILQTAVLEAMLCIDETELNFCSGENLNSFSAVGIGPGVGKKKSMQQVLQQILERSNHPMVIDADALNILSENKDWFKLLSPNTILTPHPGEFDRLTQRHQSGYARFLTQLDFSKNHKVIVVLKGAFTSITLPNGRAYFNTTGNPGMATAGSGDVLTGIILSLLAQGYTPIEAACIGPFLHGFAGDLVVKNKGEEALIASDIIKTLGKAFRKIKKIQKQ